MDMPTQQNMPKKACMITLMFPAEDDTDALVVKQGIDALIKDMKEKRFTFQIVET